jgi:cytochrome c oxidase assembly protein subunit 11
VSVRAENKKLFVRLAVIAAGMFGFGYALVPFYYEICRVWQVNLLDKPDATPLNTQVDASRTVTIELDSNTHKIAWQFRPLVSHVSVHPGELTTVEYEVVNTRPTPVTGQAVASYGPQFAGEYFKKLQCFCFTQQTLAAGETRRMPVSFIVDPRLPKDVTSIALSYTFFEVDGRGGKS